MQNGGGESQNMQKLCQHLQNLSEELFRVLRKGRFYLTLQSDYFITRTYNLLTTITNNFKIMKKRKLLFTLLALGLGAFLGGSGAMAQSTNNGWNAILSQTQTTSANWIGLTTGSTVEGKTVKKFIVQ